MVSLRDSSGNKERDVGGEVEEGSESSPDSDIIAPTSFKFAHDSGRGVSKRIRIHGNTAPQGQRGKEKKDTKRSQGRQHRLSNNGNEERTVIIYDGEKE